MKSRAESTKDARTDNDEDVKVTMIFATSSNTFAMKLTNMARLTIRDRFSRGSSSGRREDSSLKETRRDGGNKNSEGRRR